ncbi:MAG: CCA tRNA nucleotidyltransferase [Alphaproteobacteria bacterium]|nr:CCA tRNA nucleotidyltransferase [Alphaproteobacteria bacterium]
MTLNVKHKIPVQSWMSAAFIKKVFTALQGSIPSEEPQALLVGGCVRNALLGKEVDDIDIATPLEPQSVTRILEKEKIKVIPTGIKHGTVTIVSNTNSHSSNEYGLEGRDCDPHDSAKLAWRLNVDSHSKKENRYNNIRYEITTLRRDDKTDGRHAEISFTESWVEDAKRRDFTLNTLLMDLEGNIYDPLGCGFEAAQKHHIRFVGEPSMRIAEDYLRILRFFRFNAYYSEVGIYDEEGLKACRDAAPNIKKLSRERITQEFFKILSAQKPHEVLRIMFSHGVLSDLPPKDYDAEFFEYFCTFQSRYGLQALASRLLVFAGLKTSHVKAMDEYLLIPKVFIKDMACILGALKLNDLSCDSAIHESLYKFGRSATAQALIIELVQDRVMNGYAPKALKTIQNWDIRDFPVSGEDLITRGAKPGPALGKELARLEQLWIDNGFSMDGVKALEDLL